MATELRMGDTPEWVKGYWEKSLELSSTHARIIEELEAKLEARAGECEAKANIIEELEAKLAKAVGALGDIHNGEPEWPDDPQKELDWCRNRAGTTLAELKREK